MNYRNLTRTLTADDLLAEAVNASAVTNRESLYSNNALMASAAAPTTAASSLSFGPDYIEANGKFENTLYQTEISGRASAGNTIQITHNNALLGQTTANQDGVWKLDVPKGTNFKVGDKVTATDTGTSFSKTLNVERRIGPAINTPFVRDMNGRNYINPNDTSFKVTIDDLSLARLTDTKSKMRVTYPGGNFTEHNLTPGNNVVTVRVPNDQQPLQPQSPLQYNSGDPVVKITFVDEFGNQAVDLNTGNKGTNPTSEFLEVNGSLYNTGNVSGIVTELIPEIGNVPTYNITGNVWNDADGSGTKSGEENLANVTVHLLSGDKKVIATTITSGNGNYRFDNVAGKESYRVQFEAPNRFVPVKKADSVGLTSPIISNLSADQVVNSGFRRVKHYEVRTETTDFETKYEENPNLPQGVEVVKVSGKVGIDRVIYEQKQDVLDRQDLTEDNFKDYFEEKSRKHLIEKRDEVIIRGTGSPNRDGLTPVVTTKRTTGTVEGSSTPVPGTLVTVVNKSYGPDGNIVETPKTTFIPDGKDGEKGAQGEPGKDGKDGITYKPVVEKGQDGTTTIKFYPVDPSTGEPDKTKDPVATGEVKDGAKGEKGE
ncbi:G5 domain-containing protein, partial [Aerococcus urinaehominis]